MPCIFAGLLGLRLSSTDLYYLEESAKPLLLPLCALSPYWSGCKAGTPGSPSWREHCSSGRCFRGGEREESGQGDWGREGVCSCRAGTSSCLLGARLAKAWRGGARGSSSPVSRFIAHVALPNPFPNLGSCGLQWHPGNWGFLFEHLYFTVGVPPFRFFSLCLSRVPSLLVCQGWGGTRRPAGSQGMLCGPWAGSAMRWEGHSHSPNIFCLCVCVGCAGCGPGNFGNLVLDLLLYCYSFLPYLFLFLSCSWRTFCCVF